MIKKLKRFFRKTILVDVNALPEQYKQNNKVSPKMIEKYEDDHNINIVPLDQSVQNTRSNTNSIVFKI